MCSGVTTHRSTGRARPSGTRPSGLSRTPGSSIPPALTSVTIGKFMTAAPNMPLPPDVAGIFDTMSGWFMKDTFEDHTDRDSAISAYRRNNEKVRETVPPERLLVFNVADGWEPLCAFLGVPVPDTPFPRSHPRDEFWAHFGGEPA